MFVLRFTMSSIHAGSFFWRGLILFGIQLTLQVAAEAGQTVLIHYVNETSPVGQEAADYAEAIENFKRVGTDHAQRIAKNLEREPANFRTAMDAERALLIERLTPKPVSIPVCCFDNGMARNRYFEVLHTGSAEAEQVSFDIPVFENERLAANPLSTPVGLHSCLAAVTKRFPTDSCNFILVVKSHGSIDFSMSIQFPRLRELTQFENVVKALEKPNELSAVTPLGTTKEQFFAVLADAGKQLKMQFKAVVLESCDGVLDHQTTQSLPRNIETFYASGNRKLEFQSIDYDQMLRGLRTSDEFVDQLDVTLSKSFVRMSHRRTTWLWLVFGIALLVLTSGIVKRIRTNSISGRIE